VAVAATKTFVTQVATLVMLAADVAHQFKRLSAEKERELVAALRRLPKQAERTIELAGPIEEIAARYADAAGFMYIGRSFGYPAALEGALKIKEISYLHAEGYAAGELKHGPISLLDADVPLVAVATRSAVYDKLISNLMEGKARDARVLAVATEGDTQIERLATDVCWVPDTLEPLSTILAVIPLQLFAYYVAVKRSPKRASESLMRETRMMSIPSSVVSGGGAGTAAGNPDRPRSSPEIDCCLGPATYSTVTDLARLRGWSTSRPRFTAT
jgi:glucosamine--fructose-6-phosphate aminotransferase (isomerizing)